MSLSLQNTLHFYHYLPPYTTKDMAHSSDASAYIQKVYFLTEITEKSHYIQA